MTSSGNLEQLKAFFREHHAKVKPEWFEQKLGLNSSSNITDFNKIFQQWLNEDWIQEKNEYCLQSLPKELNLSLLNVEKLTFRGHFILQVEKMIDISRPLPTKIDERIKAKDKRRKEKQREKIDNEDKLNEEGNEKKGKYGTKVKENGQVKFYGYGRRLWQFCLTDGYQKCLAIEYEPLNWLKKPIIGQKILLIGPFDVYMGTIMVKNSNLQLLTTNVPSITLNDIDFNEILEEYDVELEMEALGNQDDTWKF